MAQDSLSALLDGQGIVAADPVMYALYQKAAYLAKMDATILLCGESGVGKDRLAKFVHQAGPRRDAPFIHVNCSAVPQALFEAELFGYESGTFTGGLTQGKQGLLEAAHGGTLFLDEIGEMSLANQVKLLDFLQTRQVARLGGGRRRDLDVRVISATNRDLKACVAQGIFREDLYYRICVVVLDIPPLRARPADIAAFAKGFLARSCPGRALTEDAVAFLQAQDWPGNLRELNNFLERACILSEEEAISASLLAPFYQNAPRPAPPLPADLPPAADRVLTLKEAMAQFERAYILQAIEQTDTLAQAADRLGVDLDTLNRKKRQYKIYKRWKMM